MKPTHFLILDRPHGSNVNGKQSPDGKHKEYIFGDAVINTLIKECSRRGYPYGVTAYNGLEPGLSTRVRRANELATNAKAKGLHPLMLSLHNNAAAKEGWSNATGIEVWTSPGQTGSDKYATHIMNKVALHFPSERLRVDMSDGDPDKEAPFTVLMGREYDAILVEFLFQDSVIDIHKLMSREIFEKYIVCLLDFIDDIMTWKK